MNFDRKLGLTLTATALAFACLATPLHAAERGDIEFVSGGVGLDARQQLQSRIGQYNLHLEFAAMPSGEYLSDVEVTITDVRGGTVLATQAEGPWLLARLPAGTYTVSARTGDTMRRQQLSLGSGRRHVVMRFPAAGEQNAGGTRTQQYAPARAR